MGPTLTGVSGSDAARLFAETASWLSGHGVQDEVLAELGQRRGVLGIGRRPSLEPIGRVWRLGVLLVGSGGEAFATGALTRASPPKHSNYQSVSQEERRDIRRLAYESPKFAEGESVNYGASALDLSVDAVRRGSGPLLEVDGVVTVEWAPGQHRVPLASYLDERRRLLVPHDGWSDV